MRIVQAAEDYCLERGVARTVVFSANRLARYLGDLNLDELNREKLLSFVNRATNDGLSAWTVKGTLKDIATVAACNKLELDIPTVRVPRPAPSPTALSEIDAIWKHLGLWSRQWLAISFWTALRLDDSIELQVAGLTGETIRWTASKTKRQHVWPFPSWLRKMLETKVELPYSKASDHAQVIIRSELERCSRLASVKRVKPKELRQCALNAWAKANATAGAIVHGCGLGVLSHYLCPLQILESAAPRVRLPECFGAVNSSGEDSLVANFRRLDPGAQGLLAMTAERLAAG